jgi:hypothetical protein
MVIASGHTSLAPKRAHLDAYAPKEATLIAPFQRSDDSIGLQNAFGAYGVAANELQQYP